MAPTVSTLRPQASTPLDAKWWIAGTGPNRHKWRCTACNTDFKYNFAGARRHDTTPKHLVAVAYKVRQASQATGTTHTMPPSVPGVPREAVIGPLSELLGDITDTIDRAPPNVAEDSETVTHAIDWETVSAELGGDLAPSAAQAALSSLTSTISHWLIGGDNDNSDSEDAEVVKESDGESSRWRDHEQPDPLAAGIRRPARTQATDPLWCPWPDKQMLQLHCGVESIRYAGPLGHIYYANDLEAIIAQEIANPLVRPHLRFFPEYDTKMVKESWQSSRWQKELSSEIATPMIRLGHQDYFIYEPARLHDGRMIVPIRWFTRASADGSTQDLYGTGWILHAVRCGDGRRGYVVHESDEVQFASTALSLSFPVLVQTFETDDAPDLRIIVGRKIAGDAGVHPWAYTDPCEGNPWRARAKGHRVVSFPIWLYCDETSGNMSKKWNKHNSWLFTPAGLPRALAQQESNVHFLSTSNSAPPLEMLHGIVGQLEKGQTEGFWAWDIVEQAMILVIPVVLAILGDNPMQSELSCHVGLAGKLFCRVCKVHGHEAIEPAEAHTAQPNTPGGISSDSHHSASDASSQSAGSAASASGANGKGKRKETMQELVDRARRFLGDNTLRHKDQTLGVLQEIFRKAATVGGMTKAKQLKTEHGVKDTFQEAFLERIFAFSRKLRGSVVEKQRLLDAFVAEEIPHDTISPVWRIKDLDPHQDTPVEILHVVLLGFIKYFWRDAVARVPKDKKELLKTRISSLDVAGLGFPPLSGETLVTYAGSLTGRDFRAISQIAPFVLYDLVPSTCFDAWVALSALVLLIWQPEISDLDQHLVVLQAAIDRFLTCTARWTPRWFNKPKFHILQHLVPHIRRFGPAILFATEGFESFNAVVRGKSIHSNRQAPSRDIARAFAWANRTRHLLSGGVFLPRPAPETPHTPVLSGPRASFSDNPAQWKSAGPLPLALAATPRFHAQDVIRAILPKLDCLIPATPGACTIASAPPKQGCTTLMAAHLHPPPFHIDRAVQPCASVRDSSGTNVEVGNWILADERVSGQPLRLGRVSEILQILNSRASHDGRADFVLIESYSIYGVNEIYNLPCIRASGWKAVCAEHLLCTVNVQHNCAKHGCTDSARAPVFRERERALLARPRIGHRDKGDLILNTFQMRDAVHLQRLRVVPPEVDREDAILAGARAEIDMQKSQATAAAQGKKTPARRMLDMSARQPAAAPAPRRADAPLPGGGAPS